METRPQISVIVYGSLLAPSVLDDLFEDLAGRIWPIRLQEFERVCNQTASWRGIDANQRAVLNVRRADDAWCNGLVVTDLQRGEFEAFRERERGYRLVEVHPDHIDLYEPHDIDAPLDTTRPSLDDQDLVLVTTGTKVDHEIDPIPSYLEECIDGASQWGGAFLADFKATTATNAGSDLTTYCTDQQ
jgi:hypothetical protein